MTHREQQKQPRGLYLLFFTELWERFGFYMVQTILVLYMSQGLQYSDSSAYLLYGAFSSMLYLSPVFGGYIADQYIGFRQSIVLGGILFMVGYAVMAIPDQRALFLGLSIVILGNGFFKPNVSSIVGELYTLEDPRRDGGFTLFYMGINIGSLIPPIFAGALVAAYTWGAGFLLASLGMVVALITFLVGKSRLGKAGAVRNQRYLARSQGYKVGFYMLLSLGIIVSVGILHLILYHPKETNLILIIASLGVISVVFYYIYKEKLENRRRMIASIILIVISVGFWAVYNQTYTSLMLFAERNMEKDLLGFTIDAEFTQFFNPFFIIVLSPILSRLWVRLDASGLNPSTPMKFSVATLFMAAGFLVLGLGVMLFHTAGGKASPWWLILSYFLQTIGELLISPIGLAMVTKLTPKRLVGMMMGVWFLTQSAAYAIGGGLATISDVPKKMDSEASLEIYSHAFFIYGAIALVLAILSFVLVPFLKNLIGSIEGPAPTPKR